MKSTRFALWVPVLVAVLLAVALPVPVQAQAEDDEAYLDDHRSGDFGRVRVAEDGVTVDRSRSDEGEGEDLTANSPIFPGDILRTDRDQRVEVELAGGTLLRIDRDSEVNFQALPDPYAEHPDHAVLAIDYGAIELSARLGDREEFRIDTPASSIYVVGDGVFRIDVDERGRTSVLSRRGVAEVVGEDGSVLVRAGMSTNVLPGTEPDEPRGVNLHAADGFDRWCENRDSGYRDVYRAGDRYDDEVGADDLPYTVRPYYRELSSQGRWIHDPTYGSVWYPVGMAPGWRPYHDGYWSHSPRGYFWVSNEPWGWAPYHYGRWVHLARYGWSWCPGRIFSGAWVSWSWGSAYFGWSPLDYWNRPVVVRSVVYDYYDPSCWNFIGYDRIVVRDYRRHYVPISRIGVQLRTHAVSTRPPRISPATLAHNVAARQRAVDLVRQDRGAHVAPIRRDRKPDRRFVDLEDGALRRGAVRRQATEVRRTDGGRAPAVRKPAAGGPGKRVVPSTLAGPGTQRRGTSPGASARPRPGTPQDRVRTQDRETDNPSRRVAPGAARTGRPEGRGSPRDEAVRERSDRPAARPDRPGGPSGHDVRRVPAERDRAARPAGPAGGRDDDRGASAGSADRAPYPRRLTSPGDGRPQQRSRVSEREDGAKDDTGSRARDVRDTRERPRGNGGEGQDPNDRLRDMYREFSRPRTTREAERGEEARTRDDERAGPRESVRPREVEPRRPQPQERAEPRRVERREQPPPREDARPSPPPPRQEPRSQPQDRRGEGQERPQKSEPRSDDGKKDGKGGDRAGRKR